jgi:hypothetical protein
MDSGAVRRKKINRMHTLEILGDESGFASKVISGNLAASTVLSYNIYVGI